MVNKFLILLFIWGLKSMSFAQIQDSVLVQEDPMITQMKKIGLVMIQSEKFEQRRDANYALIKQLTKYLDEDNSFTKPLDSLRFISVQQPADNAFRIMTWQVETIPGLVRHYGAIQMNSKKLKLIPLTDRSDDMEYPEEYVGDAKHWYGALYYDIQPFNTSKGKAYLLYGFDSNTPLSNKKLLDVLYISKTGDKLLFGAPIFPNFKNPEQTATRFILEYKEEAHARLSYDNERKEIIFDHLVPFDDKVDEGIYANYIPDGTFNALGFDKTKFFWVNDAIEILPQVFDPRVKSPVSKSDTIYQSNSKE